MVNKSIGILFALHHSEISILLGNWVGGDPSFVIRGQLSPHAGPQDQRMLSLLSLMMSLRGRGSVRPVSSPLISSTWMRGVEPLKKREFSLLFKKEKVLNRRIARSTFNACESNRRHFRHEAPQGRGFGGISGDQGWRDRSCVTPQASFGSSAGGSESSMATRPVNLAEDVPFTSYSHDQNAAYWSTRPVTVAKRLVEVGSAFGSWLAAGKLPMLRTSNHQERIARRAESLRRLLTGLGPAYIKIGQAVSTRPDVMPPEFLKELEKLQDRLEPFSTKNALKIMQDELGRPPLEIFSYISPEPVAAASLGQVYRAVLRKDESQVAVKVQRPGVAVSIALDVLVLRKLAAVLRKLRKFNTDLPALIDEWAISLFKELNYRSEAANGIRFRQLYGKLEGVYVPQMYTELTTQKVLVMEWVEGERIRSAYTSVGSNGFSSSGEGAAFSSSLDADPAISRDASESDLKLVEVGVRCSLEQLLEHGFYHADPHPGNLLRMKDGRLCYLDFGMMGEVDVNIRRGLIRATLHLVNREYAALADDFITLGMLPSDADREAVVPALTGVFAEALAGGVSNLSFGDLSANLGRTMYQFSFRIPSYYTLLVRSLSVLEGIALASDPRYVLAGYPGMDSISHKAEPERRLYSSLLHTKLLYVSVTTIGIDLSETSF